MNRDSFIKYLQFEKRYSPHTISAYRSDLDQFFNYLKKQNLKIDSPASITHFQIRNWIVALLQGEVNQKSKKATKNTTEKLTTRSVNRKLSTLKTYFRFLVKRGIIDQNPMQKIASPKSEKKLPQFLSKQQMQSIFQEIEQTDGYAGILAQIVFQLLYATGIRRAELIGLTNNQVNLKEQYIRVIGKGNKERIIPIAPGLADTLHIYIAAKEKHIETSTSDRFLQSSKGKALYPVLVNRIVNQYVGKVSTMKHKSPHLLRHTFASLLLNNGAPLNAIKDLLGHSNLQATQIYTHTSIKKLKEVYKQAHPRA